MANKLAVKVIFNDHDPFDAKIIPVLMNEKNKAGFVRKAVFCFIRSLAATSNNPAFPAIKKDKDHAINEKLSKLTDF